MSLENLGFREAYICCRDFFFLVSVKRPGCLQTAEHTSLKAAEASSAFLAACCRTALPPRFRVGQ